MQKKNSSQSGFTVTRILAALVLCSVGLVLTLLSLATPTPPADTLSTAHRIVTYTDNTGAPPNLTGVALGKPNCGPTGAACSIFTLHVDPSVALPAAGYNPSDYQINVQWSWAVSTVDYDQWIEDATGTSVIAKNNSTADPASVILPTNLPAGDYKFVVVLATGAPIPYTGTIKLEPKPISSSGCNPATTDCTPPRYQSYAAAQGQSDDAAEPSIGVDWNPNVAALKHDKVNTGGVAFFTSNKHEWRVNFDDCSSPAINLWENVSTVFDQTAPLADPIGFVDHYSSQQLGLAYPPVHTPGRIFSIQLLGGQGNSIGGYSDDDGNNYLPGGNGGPVAGPDHETLGGGPYSGTPPTTASYPASGEKHAIYYCSQNIVAEAQCSRSDDGGQTFGPGIPIYTPTQCTGGTTGHVKVARDGTVYVPNMSCSTVGTTGVAVSLDNGLTWTENNIPSSTSSQDPSIGIGQNDVGKPGAQTTNTLYIGYVDGDNRPKVAHSGNRGVTWSAPVDVGTPIGVTHAVFPVVVAGDDNRASFAFLGTGDGITAPGTTGTCDPYGATLNCANLWHLYISTTYDGGNNWITIDATPTDPVQTGTICLQGTTCLGGRNLADFNDFAIDAEGRGLVGYADGCVNCANTFQAQSSANHGTVTRQSGGRRLFHFFDPAEPTAPAAPQLVSAVSQPTGGVLVTWLEPDNGGSAIIGYNVYRGPTSGGESPTPLPPVQVGGTTTVTGASTTKYLDTTLPPGTTNAFYYITAVNMINNVPVESTHCREVSLVPSTVGGGNTCSYPYVNVDPPGSAGTAPDATGGEQTIQYVDIGEPFTTCSDNSLTFIMKVKTLDPTGTGNAVLPPNTEYQIIFSVKDTNGNPQNVYVAMDTDCPNPPALPTFTYGRRDPSATGGTFDQGECSNQPGNPVITCPKISGSYSADGTIIIKLDVSTPLSFSANSGAASGQGLPFTWDAHAPGSKLTAINGNVTLFVGCAAGFLETVSTTSGGAYTRKGNASCQNTPPLAGLAATPMSGPAPLNVSFDATSSHEPAGACGTISSYTLDFGDGASATNNTGMFQHTYTTTGDFRARLTVTDTVGQVSTNSAELTISVTTSGPPLTGVVSRRAHSGGVNPPMYDVTVLPQTNGQTAIECRTADANGRYTLVFGFDNTLSSVGGVTATATANGGGTQAVGATGQIGADTHQYLVTLSGVPNAQYVTVTLNNVLDSANKSGNVSATLGFLLGDVNATGLVDGNDVSAVQGQTTHTPDSSNFRMDVNCTGLIDGNDVSLTQGNTRNGLPTAAAAAPSSVPAKAPSTAPAGKKSRKQLMSPAVTRVGEQNR